MERSGQLPFPRPAAGVQPGAVSALLSELARTPERELREAWERGLRVGSQVGRFEILREVGRGGFALVYEALDRELGRSVAFKVIRPGDPAMLGHKGEALRREAEAVARLSHENIVTLHDIGTCESGPYLILEMLEGETLAGRLERGQLPPREAVRVAAEVVKALVHAHAAGVVHRDLKPGNVFLTRQGKVKVLDFGLSRLFGDAGLGQSGTPGYMAPEQWRGEAEDERTDIFAVGVMLFEMLTGRLPFAVRDGRSAALDPGPAPPLDAATVPRLLRAPIASALSKDPAGRPRNARVLLEDLLAAERALEPASAAPSRRRLWTGLLAAAVLLASGIAAWRLWPRSPEPVAARVPVAVADFENQTGEAELGGLSGMLIASLEQSRHLSVLTRSRMMDILRQMGRESGQKIDETLGREIGVKAGARALVLATIHRFDQLYAIEMKVLDPATNEYLFALKEEGTGKSSVPGMIDRLSGQTRERLREKPADVQASRVKVAEATTASFDAWQHYFRGEQHKDATRYEPAMEEYRQAVAADPTFALAHYQLAYLGEFTGVDSKTRQAEIEAALRHVDRVPEKERLLVKAWKAHMDGKNDEAHALYARAVEAYPQDKEALYMAGDLYFHEDRPAESLPFFERALGLDPFWEPASMHLADGLAWLGRKDELLAHSRRWVEKAPSATSYRALAWAHLLGGRWQDALQAARRAFDLDGSIWSRVQLAEILNLLERYEEAEAQLKPAAEPTASGMERTKAIPALASAVAYQGRRREALRIIETLPEGEGVKGSIRHLSKLLHLMGDDKAAEVLREAHALAQASEALKGGAGKGLACILALYGDLEGAAERAKKLSPGRELQQYEAAAAWRRGDRSAALSLLRDLAQKPELDDRPLTLWMLAQVALEERRDAEAIAALEGFGTIPVGPWRSWAYPRSLYLLAAAHERLGDHPRARERVEHLLALWKRADADLPLVRDAKALLKKVKASEKAAAEAALRH